MTNNNNKTAYPNNEDQYMHIPGQRNTDKWINAVKEILFKENNGLDNKTAISQVTSGWGEVEVYDFINWFKYYKEGAHLKYKYAQSQFYYGDLNNGYMIPVKKEQNQESPPADVDFSKDMTSDSEKKHLIEKQRNKIIGRLDSVEKLLRTDHGHMFSGKEFESLLEAIYDLKKRIQMINKKTTSSKSYDDLIVRQANILNKNGFVKAASYLSSIAEEKEAPLSSAPETATPGVNLNKKTDKSPVPASPAPPAQGSGSASGDPTSVPGAANSAENTPNNSPNPAKTNTPPVAVTAPAIPKEPLTGIPGFMEKLRTGPGSNQADDCNDVLEVQDDEQILTVEAQALPDAPLPPAAPEPPLTTVDAPPAPMPAKLPKPPENKLEVSEDDIKKDNTDGVKSEFDSKIDIAFANLKVDDVVAKLEDLAKVFKTREIPRQLAIVDMMLDQLGFASFFPSLSEATNKSLESNNYISTRVEDIISKLRGAMVTHDIDLNGNEVEQNPEVSAIKNKLQSDTEKEKARKEMRKEQENQDLEAKTKPTPDIEVEEELAPSAPPPAAPKAPASPAPVI
jgi:hypothetical protein